MEAEGRNECGENASASMNEASFPDSAYAAFGLRPCERFAVIHDLEGGRRLHQADARMVNEASFPGFRLRCIRYGPATRRFVGRMEAEGWECGKRTQPAMPSVFDNATREAFE